jgi:hypothetical protein
VSLKAGMAVFAGIHLMTDSTPIISLGKIIILPILNLGCQ